MPRIYINEKDKTSPGTPGGYSNNTVLIAGFSAHTDEEIKEKGTVQADDNGIFEFTSKSDFERTIGLVAPNAHKTVAGEGGPAEANLPAHYGNQMAYELLKMGYPVIYINLGLPYEYEVDEVTGETTDNLVSVVATKMKALGDESTWEIFKDKASYDFRFISHGLLTSSETAKSDDLIKLEARVDKMSKLLHKFDEELTPFEDYKVVEDPDKGVIYTDDEGNELTRDEVLQEAAERVFAKVIEQELKYVYVDGDTTAKITDAAAAIGYTEAILGNCKTYELALAEIARQVKAVEEANQKSDVDPFSDADLNAANVAIAKLAHYKAKVGSDGNEDEMDPASGRGDCIALVEVDESKYITKVNGKRPEALIIDAIKEMSSAGIDADTGKYCACTVPSVVYTMTPDDRFGNNRKFPGAFHYLACFDNALGLGFAEWYAAAGYTRGVASYAIDHTSVKLGEVAINALEPRNLVDDPQKIQPKFAVNVIANFRGSYYLWGNRTCHPLGSAAGGGDLVASHFLNIRQLCTTIKKQLYVSCRRFTFDPNSDILWLNFKSAITPMLERMKADQGIRDYRIEKIYTDKKATLKARLRIVPIEAVEDFLLEVSLEDSFGETAVTVTE